MRVVTAAWAGGNRGGRLGDRASRAAEPRLGFASMAIAARPRVVISDAARGAIDHDWRHFAPIAQAGEMGSPAGLSSLGRLAECERLDQSAGEPDQPLGVASRGGRSEQLFHALGNRRAWRLRGVFAPGISPPQIQVVAVILAADLFHRADHAILDCRIAVGQGFGQGWDGRSFRGFGRWLGPPPGGRRDSYRWPTGRSVARQLPVRRGVPRLRRRQSAPSSRHRKPRLAARPWPTAFRSVPASMTM